MLYSELKSSPLGKHNASPEEIAVWFDLHEMNNAKCIKQLMNAIERNYHTKIDWFYDDVASTSITFASLLANMHKERPSSIILRNIFIFMFKTIEMKEKDVDQLIKFSKNKIDSLFSKRKKIINHAKTGCIMNAGALSQIEDLLEVYGEMNDRLCKLKIHEITSI